MKFKRGCTVVMMLVVAMLVGFCLGFTPANAATSHHIVYNMDTVEVTDDNNLRLYGWAYDEADPSKSIEIVYYKDGSKTSTFTTNSHRTDVNAAKGIDGLHGIDMTIDTHTYNGEISISLEAYYSDGSGYELIYFGYKNFEGRFIIHYDANGGTGAPSDQIKQYGSDIKLSSIKPTRSGYTFTGWSSTSRNATVSDYNANYTYTKNADLTLYAQWKQNEYTIKYDANGGTGAPGDQTKYGGTTLTLSSDKPTREGYTFQGWSTSSSATSATYQPGGSYTLNASRTLYAVWKLNPHIVFSVDTVEVTSENKLHVYGWAFDESDTSTAIGIEIYRGFGETIYATQPTTGHRTDVNDAYGIDGLHGFDITVDTSDWVGSQSIWIAAHYADSATAAQLYYTTLVSIWSNTLTFTPRYTVAYDANGGSNAPSDQTKTYGTDLTLTTSKPSRTGHTFLGWATASDATTAEYSSGGSYTADKAVTLYAVWKPYEYTIKYNANGGTGAPGDQIIYYGTPYTISTVQPTRDGYDFQGWATSSTATTAQYQSGGTSSIYSGRTLYAVWKLKEYTIWFDANGGENAPAEQTKTHGVTLKLTTDEPTREGYTFLGWGGNRHVTKPAYKPGDDFDVDASMTLYAVWQEGYTVHYDANGGENPPDDQIKYLNTDLWLTGEYPDREGYTFRGWATSPDSSIVAYYPADLYKANAPITLYALWKLNEYTITFDAMGGQDAPADQIKYHGIDLTLPTQIPTRENYTFMGWNMNGGDEELYKPGGSYPWDGDATMYARWQRNYHFTTEVEQLEAINGCIYMKGWVFDELYTDESTNLILKIRQIPNYSFRFSTSDNRDDVNKQHNITGKHGFVATLTKDWITEGTYEVELYAQYPEYRSEFDVELIYSGTMLSTVQYTVSFSANGGSGIPEDVYKKKGTTLTLPTTVPVQEGYDFLGWQSSNISSDTMYQPGGAYDLEGDNVLQAAWQLKRYAVTYDANGGTGAPADQQKVHGTDLTLQTAEPVWEGYVFQGWALAEKPGEVAYAPGATYTADAPASLTAVWKASTSTISFDANGGSGAPDPVGKSYRTPLTLPDTVPEKTNCDFLGWAASPTATSAAYAPGGSYEPDGDATLYAVWTARRYTIHFDANGGDGAPSDMIKVHGVTLWLPTDTPTREGYNFAGWGAVPTSKSPTWKAGGDLTNNASRTLYAVWSPDTFIVTYDANGGTGEPDSFMKTYGVDVTLSMTVPSMDGFDFAGWSLNGTDCDYQPGDTFKLNNDATLYALWKEKEAAQPFTASVDGYSFGNSASDFGYTSKKDPYPIPLTTWQEVLGQNTAKSLYKTANTKGWSGNCFGMAATAALLYAGDVSVSGFGGSSTYDLNVNASSGSLTLKKFIEMMMIAQFANGEGQPQKVMQTDNRVDAHQLAAGNYGALNRLVYEIRQAAENGQGVLIGIGTGGNGHALLASGVEDISGSESRIKVYDCNFPGEDRYINLTGYSGNYTGWSYEMVYPYGTWGNAQYCWISYIPYSVLRNVWNGHASFYGSLLNCGSDNLIIRNNDGEQVATVSDGQLVYAADDVYAIELLSLGGSDGDLLLHLPSDYYEITSTDGSALSLTLADGALSASVDTTASAVIFGVIDSLGLQDVMVESPTPADSYAITLETILSGGDMQTISLSGMGQGSSIQLSLGSGGLSLSLGMESALTSLTLNGVEQLGNMITASTSQGGSISPVGDSMVLFGGDMTYTITPDEDYVISSVLIDGIDLGPMTTYTFRNVQGRHSIYAVFTSGNSITGATCAGGKVNVSLVTATGGRLMAAAYRADGSMIAMKSVNVTSGTTAASVNLGSVPSGATVKVMLVDEMWRPLCQSYAFEIEN